MSLPMPAFPQTWSAAVLRAAPLIAPARRFIYPQTVPGEEDALARGALEIEVRTASNGAYLVTCALGFRDPSLPSGVWACPAADDMLAVAGGYAYLADTRSPERCLHLDVRPVTAVLPAIDDGLLLLAGFHTVTAVGADGVRWRSGRLSWEGVQMIELRDGALLGTGWDMMADRDRPFRLDLRTGQHTGGGYPG